MGLSDDQHLHELDGVRAHTIVIRFQQVEDLVFDGKNGSPHGLHVVRHSLGLAQPTQSHLVQVRHCLKSKANKLYLLWIEMNEFCWNN